MTRFNTVDDFLSHSTQSNGSAFLGTDWQKRGFIDVVMLTSVLPFSVWRHGFPRVDIRQEKGSSDQEKRVFGGNWGCHEPESVLKNQYFRDDNGVRRQPPFYCPLCRMAECVHLLIEKGELAWTKPIFRFEADDPKKTQVLHAGGIINMFRADKLDDAKRAELKKAGIWVKDAWRENTMAKMSYVFPVVDMANITAGAQIAVVTGALGDKVKSVMNHQRNVKVLGPEKGNPFKHPYAIQWIFKEGESFDKKYDACALTLPISPSVMKIVNGPAPDTSKLTQPFNIKTMRGYLEKHCLIKLPWDEIFDVRAPDAEDDPAMAFPPAERGSTPNVSAQNAEPDTIPCDTCQHPMAPTDAVCAKCGTKYEIDENDAASVPPAVAKLAATPKKAKPTPPPSAHDVADEDDDGDALTF